VTSDQFSGEFLYRADYMAQPDARRDTAACREQT